jgi:hypothetical protein
MDWHRWQVGLYSQNQRFSIPPKATSTGSKCELECITIRHSFTRHSSHLSSASSHQKAAKKELWLAEAT